jgi:HEAT repeat protein
MAKQLTQLKKLKGLTADMPVDLDLDLNLGALFALNQVPPVPPKPPTPPMAPIAKRWGGGKLTDDEELKLAALEGLMRNDPKRAIPIVEKLIQSSTSDAMRVRVLGTLRHSDSPEAQQVVARVAKDSANPSLQSMAIKLLGSDRDNVKLLAEIYASAANDSVKRQVLRSWMAADARDEILKVAKSDSASPELRKEAIQLLGAMETPGTAGELVSMYSSTQDRNLRAAIIRALSIGSDGKALIELARKETDPELKRIAIRHLTHMRNADVTAFLMEVIEK